MLQSDPVFHTVIDLDVAGSGKRDEPLILKMRADLRDIIGRVLLACSVTAPLEIQDSGDGMRLFFPDALPMKRILRRFVQELENELRAHRKAASERAALRLRMAVHEGHLHIDPGGFTGEPLVHVTRLINSAEARNALSTDPSANLVVIVSDAIYNSVIRHDYGPDKTGFRKVTINEKETRATAWIHLPGTTVRRSSVVAIVATVTVCVIALVAAGVWLMSIMDKKDPGPTGPATAAPYPARVQKTWEESVGRPVGVFYYPSAHDNSGRFFGAAEGDVVFVVCQVRDGRLATDTPYQGRETSSRVWDKLSNGYFISDIYTDLPKVQGDTPPNGIPLCTG